MTRKQFGFFRRCLRETAESFLEQGVIDSRQCAEIQSFPNRPLGKPCATELFSRNEAEFSKYPIRLQLMRLREINGKPFDHIQIVLPAMSSGPRRVCFVGHRFVPAVVKTLRWNLRHVLEPFNVDVDWSGMDIRSVQLFDNIVRCIDRADFCIFDNRETAGRPNVYIEAAVAYALNRPFILFADVRQGTIPIPSDLSHSFAMRYTSYQKLFPEFYAKLPRFFKANLGRRPQV